jgi:hypothetical protein
MTSIASILSPKAVHLSRLVRLAAAQVRDHGKLEQQVQPGTSLLAGLADRGSVIKGAVMKNVQRNFERRVARKLSTYVAPVLLPVPYTHGRTRRSSFQNWPVIAPHHFFYMLLQTHRENYLTGDISLREFWQAFAQLDPEHEGVKAAASGDLPPFALRLHGDEGSIQAKRLLLVLSWSGLHHDKCEGFSAQASRFVYTVFPDQNYCKTRARKNQKRRNLSLEVLLDYFAWSFNVIASGVFPTEPYKNVPFTKWEKKQAGAKLGPEGQRGFCVAIKGDWKWEVEALQQERSWMHRYTCIQCDANKDTHPYWDCRPEASWRSTVRSDSASALFCHGPLKSLIGFSVNIIWPDLLHVLFWGTGRDAVSSLIILFGVVLSICGGCNVAEKLEATGLEWCAWCARVGYKSNCPHFNVKTLKYPTRKSAPQITAKAMDVKCMVQWLWESMPEWTVRVPAEFLEPANAAKACVTWLYAFIVILEVAGLVLTPLQVEKAVEAGENFLLFYSALRQWANDHGMRLFLQRPKWGS